MTQHALVVDPLLEVEPEIKSSWLAWLELFPELNIAGKNFREGPSDRPPRFQAAVI